MTKRGRHKSLEKALDRSLRSLAAHPKVKKVILGSSENARHKFSPGTLRFQREEPNGLKVNGYSGNGVTTIYVYCNPEDRNFVKNLLSS